MDKPIRISILLLKNGRAWEMILDQIGAHWTAGGDIASAIRELPSVIIVNAAITHSDKKLLTEYTAAGGAVMFTPAAGASVRKRAVSKRYLSALAPVDRAEYRFTELFDMHQTAFLFEEESLAAADRSGTGMTAYLGFDIEPIMDDIRTARKDFYSGTRPFPNERVSRSTKNAVRQVIHSLLEHLHHQRGLPFVHKWFYPYDHRSIFTFRIDSDKGTHEQIEEIFHLSERYAIPTTWFLDVKSHEKWLAYFKKFASQEIGVHCFDHVVHDNTELNRGNFGKAKKLLEQSGITPRGVSAPTGAWNVSVAAALEAEGFAYSSEFGYDYDNLPSYPPVNGGRSPVLQLPIHPVCIGSLLRSRMTNGQMVEYYKKVIDHKLRTSEPVCLYHHPTHAHNEVFEEVFQYINTLRLHKMTYSLYCDWWKKRAASRLHARCLNNEVQVDGITDSDLYIRISTSRDTEAILPPDKKIEIQNLPLTVRRDLFDPPSQLLDTRAFSMRRIAQDLLDWWTKLSV